MKRDSAATAATTEETPPADATPATDAPAEVTDTGATEGEQLFEAKHEWPTAGGSYVRQEDGTLKREG